MLARIVDGPHQGLELNVEELAQWFRLFYPRGQVTPLTVETYRLRGRAYRHYPQLTKYIHAPSSREQ